MKILSKLFSGLKPSQDKHITPVGLAPCSICGGGNALVYMADVLYIQTGMIDTLARHWHEGHIVCPKCGHYCGPLGTEFNLMKMGSSAVDRWNMEYKDGYHTEAFKSPLSRNTIWLHSVWGGKLSFTEEQGNSDSILRDVSPQLFASVVKSRQDFFSSNFFAYTVFHYANSIEDLDRMVEFAAANSEYWITGEIEISKAIQSCVDEKPILIHPYTAGLLDMSKIRIIGARDYDAASVVRQ